MTDQEEKELSDYAQNPTPALDAQVGAILRRPAVQADLATLRVASQRPYSVFPLDWSKGFALLFPHMARFRGAARMVVAQAVLSARQGHPEEALAWWEVSLRMSNHALSEPTVIGQLVGYAMQALAFRPLKATLGDMRFSSAAAARLDHALAGIDLGPPYLRALQGERACGLDTIDRVHRQDIRIRSLLDYSPSWQDAFVHRVYASPFGAPLRALDEGTYLKITGECLRISALPYREAGSKLSLQGSKLADLPKYLVMTRLIPIFEKAPAKRDDSIVNIHLCRIALALKAYEYERHHYPESLKELQTTIDWTMPVDPFSGKDYIYRRQGHGFIVYSLGQNLKDDGGVPEYNAQGKWRGQTSDIVWQCAR
jgi:hypothetical protein